MIGGEFRSRRLKTLRGLEIRPTPDRLRESLFDVLAPRIEGCVFLDAYAGTGAVGIEALSRGARRVILVEKNRAAAAVVRENLAALGLEGRSEIYMSKALPVLERVAADIVFLDPPYELENEYGAALTLLGNSQSDLVIVQHSRRSTLESDYGRLHRYRELRQGDNILSFYKQNLTGGQSTAIEANDGREEGLA